MVSAPIRPEVRLSILWVGHATVVIQIHDKVVITDPLFAKTVGMLVRRTTETGVDPSLLTSVDFILISHIHFDHLNYGSLNVLPKKARLLVPAGGIDYVPEFGFAETIMARPWETVEKDGMRITAVPVQHFGGRYGFDVNWNDEPAFTGYVLEYQGITILFAGDTGYNHELFKEIGRRFRVDVALLPIAPVEPREFMKRFHTDPAEALDIAADVGAKLMIPIHYSTFSLGLEPDPAYARTLLERIVQSRGINDRVRILDIGEQLILSE